MSGLVTQLTQKLKKLRGLLILGLAMSMTACVINTGQAGGSSETPPSATESNQGTRESRVSLKEAANFNMTLGAQYLQKNNVDQAISKLEKAVEQDADLALAHSYLGLAYEQRGESDKARRHYRKATKLDSNDPIILNNYGTFLCRHEEWRTSLKYFEKAAKNPRYQTPDAAYANAGVCARKIPDLDAATGYFRAALKVNPRYAAATYYLAEINLEQDNTVVAQAFFRDYQVLTQGKKYTPDLLWLGYRIEKALGNHNGAGQYALQLQQQFPKSVQTGMLLDRR